MISALKKFSSFFHLEMFQRRNAIDVISEVVDISTDSQKSSLLSDWQDVANNLLERLGDENIVIREQASKLFPALDPSLHLPTLISLAYSPIERQHQPKRRSSRGSGKERIDGSFLSRWENSVHRKRNDEREKKPITQGTRDIEVGYECIAALLLSRAFCDFEFEDVRKLAAELCGRIHPQVLFPVLCSKLEQAVDTKNILKIKACLLSICTSLVVRGWESFSHPAMCTIRKMIETVLLWPSLDADSVSKAQHGCIDCLALMLCAELQAEESSTNYASDKIMAFGKDVLHCAFASAVPLPFRLYMANVLISACQKIPKSCTNQFATRVLPSLLHSVESKMKSEIRAACVQVLFSSVYHLRLAVLPYVSELFKVSLRVLRNESEKVGGFSLFFESGGRPRGQRVLTSDFNGTFFRFISIIIFVSVVVVAIVLPTAFFDREVGAMLFVHCRQVYSQQPILLIDPPRNSHNC